jgi:transposase
MQKFTNQCIGIDISKATFTACLCKRQLSGPQCTSDVVEFDNNKRGFNQFVKWSRKIADSSIPLVYAMEATGIYFEGLAYHLSRLNQKVSVILPNKVKHFSKSLNIKTKTDIVDARIIAKMGAERSLELWQPPDPIFRQLRGLTRLYSELKKERTTFGNRLDAYQSGEDPFEFIVKSNKTIIKEIEIQIAKCEQKIKALIYSEEWLASKVNKLLSIKGVGLITIAIILAETQGFKLIRNGKQLVSYAGFDVVQRESGTSIKGKSKISKKGNSRIRAALYFPALVSSRYNPDFKTIYERINIGKASKMVGVTALQRKMLLLIYSLWKKDQSFIEDYPGTANDPEVITVNLPENESLNSKVGRSKDLPTQDEHSNDESPEVLLRALQI